MRTLRVAGIVDDSVVDGPGVRYTIFTQGCAHFCEDCHNPATHSYSDGQDITIDMVLENLKEHKYIKAVTFSGGEPVDQPEALSYFIAKLKKNGYHVLIYTGYTFEEIVADSVRFEAVKNADMLIDGEYMKDLRSLHLVFRGSSNQRIIDVQKSIASGKIVEIKY